MTYEHKPNTGNLRKNDFKKEDKHPDYRGTVVVSPELAGREIDIAAWIKKDKNGKPYMSLSFKEPYKKDGANAANGVGRASPSQPTQNQQGAFPDDSDLPF